MRNFLRKCEDAGDVTTPETISGPTSTQRDHRPIQRTATTRRYHYITTRNYYTRARALAASLAGVLHDRRECWSTACSAAIHRELDCLRYDSKRMDWRMTRSCIGRWEVGRWHFRLCEIQRDGNSGSPLPPLRARIELFGAVQRIRLAFLCAQYAVRHASREDP